MLTTLLFIVIIVSCETFTKGFKNRFSRKLNTRLFNPRLGPFSKTKQNVRLTSTTFYEDENGNDKRNKKYNYNYDFYSYSDLNDDIRENQFIPLNNEQIDTQQMDESETLYTLIWFDCEDCRNLLSHVKNERKQILYIDGSYYFFDENDETNTPIFYKNDELIATDVFSIYEELFYNKTMEE